MAWDVAYLSHNTDHQWGLYAPEIAFFGVGIAVRYGRTPCEAAVIQTRKFVPGPIELMHKGQRPPLWVGSLF